MRSTKPSPKLAAISELLFLAASAASFKLLLHCPIAGSASFTILAPIKPITPTNKPVLLDNSLAKGPNTLFTISKPACATFFKVANNLS